MLMIKITNAFFILFALWAIEIVANSASVRRDVSDFRRRQSVDHGSRIKTKSVILEGCQIHNCAFLVFVNAMVYKDIGIIVFVGTPRWRAIYDR